MDGLEGTYGRIARLAGRRLHLPLLCQGARELLAERMPAANCYLALLTEDGRLRFPYYIDQLEPENSLTIYPKEGLSGFVVDEARTVHAGAEPGLLDRVAFIGPRPLDWLGAPLFDRDGAVMGLLVVQTYEPGESYGRAERELLEFTACQLSFALQLQRYDRDLAIGAIASLVEETADLDELYRGVHRIVARLVPAAERCFIIARVDEEAGRFRPVFFRDEKDDWEKIDWPLEAGFSGRIYAGPRESLIFERGKTEPPEGYIPVGAPPLHWLGAPLMSGARMIGVVVVQSYEPGDPITREDEAVLVSVAPHIAHAIGRTEFYGLTRLGTR